MTGAEMDAFQAMRARGVDGADELLTHADPEAIIRTCEWWDRQTGVRVGLLVSKIRKGGIDPEPAPVAGVRARLRATHDEHAKLCPVGFAVPHVRLQELRRDDDEPCPGSMIVLTNDFPVWELECDQCGFLWGPPVAALTYVLPRRLQVVQ